MNEQIFWDKMNFLMELIGCDPAPYMGLRFTECIKLVDEAIAKVKELKGFEDE